MTFTGLSGVPDYRIDPYQDKKSEYCLLIPVINEGVRILKELQRAQKAGVDKLCDILICDGGSTDGSMEPKRLKKLGVNGLLTKLGPGRQGAQLRMGISYALGRGYAGVLTIDGNNKDSIESVPLFIKKLREGYDLVQGSRFIPGGMAVHTNAFRAYSRAYLIHPQVQPLRDEFQGYELLAYLSVRATQLGLRACEVPVVREYPAKGGVPTKISPFKGNANLMGVLLKAMAGRYNP